MVYLAMLRITVLIVALLTMNSFIAADSVAADSPAEAVPVSPSSALNVVLIIVDGMHNVNEMQYSRYMYGADKGAGFHSWPYHCYMTTWDATAYDRYAWAQNEDGADSPARYSEDSFHPVIGYDPALGGTQPNSGTVDSALDAYFTTGLPKWGETAADGTKEPATDSAAAATAFATGRKTETGNISWLPGDAPGGRLETIAERFRRIKGGSVGVASTVMFSHATPAAFAAHNASRSNYGEIASEMLTETMFDVIIGAGHPDFTIKSGKPTDKYCPAEALAAIRANSGYIVIEKIEGVNAMAHLLSGAQQAVCEHKKLFGLFGCASGQMEPIMPTDTPGAPGFDIPSGDPHAYEIALPALTVLSANENGFFLMVEQGDLDWCNHDNNYAGAIGSLRDADLCAQAVVDWINREGDDITLENTSVILLPDHTHYIRQADWLGLGDLPEQVRIEGDAESYEGDYRYPAGGPYYHSHNHTNELGNVYVIGGGVGAILAGMEGGWYPGQRIIDNTMVYAAMCQWLEID